MSPCKRQPPPAPHHCILSGCDGHLSPWLRTCCHGAFGPERGVQAALSSGRAPRGVEVPAGLAMTRDGPHVLPSYWSSSAPLRALGSRLRQPASTVLPGLSSCLPLFVLSGRRDCSPREGGQQHPSLRLHAAVRAPCPLLASSGPLLSSGWLKENEGFSLTSRSLLLKVPWLSSA